jgi:hypothetical protein
MISRETRWCVLLSGLFVMGCQTADKKVQRDKGIYLDYQVHAKEGDDNLTVLLQFRQDDEEKDVMVTLDPGEVRLDNKELQSDTTGAGDVFFETHQPIQNFAGTHSLLLKDIEGDEYEEEFDFQPFQLTTILADTIRRADLVFEFANLEKGGIIRVLMTDTSFINDGINRVDRAVGGRVTIPLADLDKLANGPVQLEFIREFQRPVKKSPGGGGRLLLTYSLSREFILAD